MPFCPKRPRRWLPSAHRLQARWRRKYPAIMVSPIAPFGISRFGQVRSADRPQNTLQRAAKRMMTCRKSSPAFSKTILFKRSLICRHFIILYSFHKIFMPVNALLFGQRRFGRGGRTMPKHQRLSHNIHLFRSKPSAAPNLGHGIIGGIVAPPGWVFGRSWKRLSDNLFNFCESCGDNIPSLGEKKRLQRGIFAHTVLRGKTRQIYITYFKLQLLSPHGFAAARQSGSGGLPEARRQTKWSVVSDSVVRRPFRATNARSGAKGAEALYFQTGLPEPGKPSFVHFFVTVSITSWSMTILRPHSRWVSGGSLLVASRPILEPRPLSGEAKSR